jgi:cold shock CspA family protein
MGKATRPRTIRRRRPDYRNMKLNVREAPRAIPSPCASNRRATCRSDDTATATRQQLDPHKLVVQEGRKDVFVHISAVERAGLNGLNEGQKISYDVQEERGKQAAVNLKA